ncbi:MAG: alcohol dehydrogenase catalytic domain-containing protein [Anaerolineae bacterium]|nr:alcohol dehydrogenase catalytic domain-containing protein [Anaerolineae bacterium]
MTDKLAQYRRAATPLPAVNRLWPLYGAGFENFGVDGRPLSVAMPEYGPDELLVRHDACSHCFSDVKVIRAGQNHPRIRRDMRQDPVVLGHEVSITVVGVGEALRDQYHLGERFTIQADIFVNGVNSSYGYEIQGGLSEYTVIDQRVLNGDQGCYLIPLQKADTGYAEAALTEPWACVIAAYQLKYRTAPRPGGVMWIIGTERAKNTYTFSRGFDAENHPAELWLTNVPHGFAAWLRKRAAQLGIEVVAVPELPDPATVITDDTPVSPSTDRRAGGQGVDDIIFLGADPDIIERAGPNLASYGIMAILDDAPMPRKVKVDVGRIHYNRWLYVGAGGQDIAAAYQSTPVRSALKPGGKALFVGAGGPMGRMHVQAALQLKNSPAFIVCTDTNTERLNDLHDTFGLAAWSKGGELVCLDPQDEEAYTAELEWLLNDGFENGGGFDDIVVLTPATSAIADAATYLAPQGVMNIFAGVPRGKVANIDLSDVYLKQVRIIGHSASTIENMRVMLEQTEKGLLSPNRSVAAIGSLEAAYDGLQAVANTLYPGKIVIYLHIQPLPLTSLPNLKTVLPTVYAKLRDGHEWTNEAEAELLRVML